MTGVSLTGVDVRLGGRRVLSGVDLEIGVHEFVGVLGANGAGKTTLMRVMLGLVPIEAGKITVLGHPVRRGNPLVGYMPQTRGVGTMRLSGRSFVSAASDGHRWGLPLLDAAARRNVDETLELVGAETLAARSLDELSGGERQRLLLAQSLLGRPRLLLLDEPLIALDPNRQVEVVTLVRQLQQRLGITVLFSAHEINPLLGSLDRVLFLGNQQASLGTVDEVITSPVLSRLYGAPIDVVRLNGRIFVMAGHHDIDQEAHRSDHHHDQLHPHRTTRPIR